jgi:hypothetical protein
MRTEGTMIQLSDGVADAISKSRRSVYLDGQRVRDLWRV